MKTGVQLIADERQFKQIEKHGFTAEHHANNPQWYDRGQLISAAHLLTSKSSNFYFINNGICPLNWDFALFKKLLQKPYEERLVIAGSLIAAELDRLNYLNKT